MAESLVILNVAVSLVIKAALLAARFSGRVRKRSLMEIGMQRGPHRRKNWQVKGPRCYLARYQHRHHQGMPTRVDGSLHYSGQKAAGRPDLLAGAPIT